MSEKRRKKIRLITLLTRREARIIRWIAQQKPARRRKA